MVSVVVSRLRSRWILVAWPMLEFDNAVKVDGELDVVMWLLLGGGISWLPMRAQTTGAGDGRHKDNDSNWLERIKYLGVECFRFVWILFIYFPWNCIDFFCSARLTIRSFTNGFEMGGCGIMV